jgi:hypothetical protein
MLKSDFSGKKIAKKIQKKMILSPVLKEKM